MTIQRQGEFKISTAVTLSTARLCAEPMNALLEGHTE